MPVISKFYGIVIRMLIARPLSARFHAIYENSELVVTIDPVRIVQGNAPSRVCDMVLEWAAQHQNELLARWRQLNASQPVSPVAPLI